MVKIDPTFSMKMLSKTDYDLLRACENAQLFWTVARNSPDRGGWSIISTFSSLDAAQKFSIENDHILAFNFSHWCWDIL